MFNPSPRWLSLWVGNDFNPRLVKLANVASGAYAIRSKKTHEVKYVGESSRGTIWKTLLRHFQAPDSFRATRNEGVFTGDPKHYEVAIHVTSRGHRPRPPASGSKESVRLRDLKRRGVAFTTEADQAAMRVQAEWIASLKPTINKDDGLVDSASEFREHRAKQEAEEASRDWWENPAEAPPKLWRVIFKGGRFVVVEVKPGQQGQFYTDRLTAERLAAARNREPIPNPSAASGALVELGALTSVEYRGQNARTFYTRNWSLREAPRLGYDDAGRLFIVYVGKVSGGSAAVSSPEERREYARTHWGQKGAGELRDGGMAPAPFDWIGYATSITYTTKKGTDPELVDYVHAFGEGAPAKGFEAPSLVGHKCAGGCAANCAARGSIALQGGSYRVTSRGIVG